MVIPMWIKIALVLVMIAFTLVVSELMVVDGKGGCEADPTLDAEEQKFLVLINQYRADNGLLQLGKNEQLSTAAQWKATDMSRNNYLAHNDLNGRNFIQRLRDFGYSFNTYMGENLAALGGDSNAQAVFNMWRDSSVHNTIMLNPNFRAIGIGNTEGYWVTDFGGIVGIRVEQPAPKAPALPLQTPHIHTPVPPVPSLPTSTDTPTTVPTPTWTPRSIKSGPGCVPMVSIIIYRCRENI